MNGCHCILTQSRQCFSCSGTANAKMELGLQAERIEPEATRRAWELTLSVERSERRALISSAPA